MKPLLDVLIIPDALEKEGSLTVTSAKLFKMPSVLSHTVHRPESGLNIQLLDRNGHRAKFTRTGQMLLEEGQEVLHTIREFERQTIKLYGGWENELVIGVDDTFPFSLPALLIESSYQHHNVMRLKFTNGVLGGFWDTLIQGRADTIAGAVHEPPAASEFDFARLGVLEQVFMVVPRYPLAQEQEPLNRRTIRRFHVVMVGDNAQHANVSGSQVLDDRETITVFDFKTKLELQISGLGCGYIPCYLAQRFLESGVLIEKKVVVQIVSEPVWIGWNEQTVGLASVWWRDEVLANSAIAGVYVKTVTNKSIS